jgi:hypothetical protein
MGLEANAHAERPRQSDFVMDVLRPFSYLAGLLNRMTITAIAASPFIRDINENRSRERRRTSLLWN